MTSTSTKFSDRMEAWLNQSSDKTLASLGVAFAEKSFAVVILLLMIIPSTPLPTGGITHILEIIAALLALELALGFKSIWLPTKWKDRQVGGIIKGKAITILVNRIRWFEKYSRSRLGYIVKNKIIVRLTGLVILIFTFSAFFAPPFSGLDTLPSLGVVLICLALILEDGALMIVGYLVGISGMMLMLFLSSTIIKLFH